MPTKYACSNGTSYAELQSYNSTNARFVNGAIQINPVPSQLIQAIPHWGSYGYNALTHDRKATCSGYFDIEGAYPRYSQGCGRYIKRACAGK